MTAPGRPFTWLRSRTRSIISAFLLGLLAIALASPVAVDASEDAEAPTAFANFDLTSISAGETHTCANLADGTIRCWGENTDGQLGDGTNTDSTIPVAVAGISTATAIGTSRASTCALLANQTIACWGNNDFGQLGDGTTTPSLTPVAVAGISNAVELAVGQDHACARLSDGTVKCWGNNGNGRLGDGTVEASSTPVVATGISTAVQLDLGFSHSCARLADGTVMCWGNNHAGQVGIGEGIIGVSLVPISVFGLTGATDITTGGFHSCAVVAGGVKCWGLNTESQLGVQGQSDSQVPIDVPAISGVVDMSAGGHHTCARLDTGEVKCWGLNFDGRLGDGANNESAIPVSVVGLSTAASISSGFKHSCALLSDDTLKCWGSNVLGQLGNGTLDNSNRPARVIGLSDIPPVGPTTFVTRGPGEDQILRIYRAVFGREPDRGGFEFWAEEFRSGRSLNSIATAFSAGPEFSSIYGQDPTTEDLVNLLYENVLGRPGDSGGITFWVSEVRKGTSVPDLIIAFADSPENITITQTSEPLDSGQSQVLRLYRAVLGRDPEPAGFDFWVDQNRGGTSFFELTLTWMELPEYAAKYGEDPTDTELIEALYQNVLGRPGDEGGVAFWLGQRQSGLSVPGLLLAFANSDENIKNTGTAP